MFLFLALIGSNLFLNTLQINRYFSHQNHFTLILNMYLIVIIKINFVVHNLYHFLASKQH